jgi:CDP-paratose 2-epimerase
MRVLITGGCGFLGSNIASAYIAEGAEVIIIDALKRVGGERNLEWLRAQASHRQLSHFACDLANDEAVADVFQRHRQLDYVCHLGGQVAMTTSLSDPKLDFRTNALGTVNVLEATRAYSPEALVAYSSTNKVYGDLIHLQYEETRLRYEVPAHPLGFDESLPLDFASPYGCSKGAADQYVRDWWRNYGLRTVVFRHSSIYGGRQFPTFDQGWIGWFCRKAVEQKTALKNGDQIPVFTIAGSGKQVRDVLHAKDLVELYKAAYFGRDKVAGEIFNIGGGVANSLSLLELFERLKGLLALETLEFTKEPRRASDQNYFVANFAKAKKILRWEPAISAQQGLAMMIDWISSS